MQDGLEVVYTNWKMRYIIKQLLYPDIQTEHILYIDVMKVYADKNVSSLNG